MPAAPKLDLYREHKAEYAAGKKPTLVTVGRAKYLAIVGRGAPGGESFQAKIGSLHAMAYGIKMFKKMKQGIDYKICPLEGLWWGARETGDFSSEPRETWNWKILIRTPDFIKKKDLVDATGRAKEKGKGEGMEDVALESLREGRCVQMLHVGPYDKIGETMAVMIEFAEEQGLGLHDRHHEIYLSDPRRVPPERLKTILRHPVKKANA